VQLTLWNDLAVTSEGEIVEGMVIQVTACRVTDYNGVCAAVPDGWVWSWWGGMAMQGGLGGLRHLCRGQGADSVGRVPPLWGIAAALR